jgi:hypothetical protein
LAGLSRSSEQSLWAAAQWISCVFNCCHFFVMEQRMNTKYCVKLSKTPIYTHAVSQTVCDDEALGRSRAFEWFKWFKDGRGALQDDPRSGSPSAPRNAETVANVREMLTWDRHSEGGWNKHQQGKERKICRQLGLERLMDEQKQRSLKSCQDLIQTCQDNPSFLDEILSFIKWKLASKERASRILNTSRKTWQPPRTLFLRPLSTVSQNFLKDHTQYIQVGEDYFEYKWNGFLFLCMSSFTPVREL